MVCSHIDSLTVPDAVLHPHFEYRCWRMTLAPPPLLHSGVHWWFKSRAHAAELTAGYYNTRDRDGYDPVFAILAKYNARVSFTCVEMRDCEHPPEGKCSPQGLLQQVIECGERHGISLAGENALQR